MAKHSFEFKKKVVLEYLLIFYIYICNYNVMKI